MIQYISIYNEAKFIFNFVSDLFAYIPIAY